MIGLAELEQKFAVGIIRGDKLLYLYPKTLLRKELLRGFLSTIILLVESVAGTSNRIIFRVGGKIYAVSRIDSNIIFFSGPPEMDDSYAADILEDIKTYLSKGKAHYEPPIGDLELFDRFVSGLIRRTYTTLRVRKVHPAKIFVVSPLGIDALRSGEIKKIGISKKCIEILKSFSPETFLGDIIEKIKVSDREISDCLEILYRRGYIVELPDMYVNTMAILKMLNIITKRAAALMGRAIVRDVLHEIVNSMPNELKLNIVFDDKKLRIGWVYSEKIARDIGKIESIKEEDYVNSIMALKLIIHRLLEKFEDILGKELREQLNNAIRKELETKLRISIA